MKLQLDRVTVVRCDTRAETYEIVYLQEKNCKHPHIQGEFAFQRGGRVVHRCLDCGEAITPYKLCAVCEYPLFTGDGVWKCGNKDCAEFDKEIIKDVPGDNEVRKEQEVQLQPLQRAVV